MLKTNTHLIKTVKERSMSRMLFLTLVFFVSSLQGVSLKAESKSSPDKKETTQTTEKKTPVVKWAVINIKGSYPEGAQAPGLFSEIVESLSSIKERIEKAGEDKEIKGLLLNIQSPQITWAKVSEISQSIEIYKKSGKKVIAYMEQAMTMDYLLASYCDEVIMPETGMILMPGIRAEVTFYKNLLDKLSIKTDMMRVGKYKSAAENLTRTSMSPEFREELTAILEDHYETLIGTIAENRNLETEKVKGIIDSAPFLVGDAKEMGLVDEAIYYDELVSNLEKMSPESKVEYDKSYGKKKRDTDFSGLAGMVKMMNLMMGVEPRQKKNDDPKIAIIYAEGMIITGNSTESMFTGKIMGSTTMVKAINKAAVDENVKAIVLRVNSPGGSALASDLIWRALQKAGKPVVVSMGSVAGSGGYYISMGADYIFSEPTTITGSIGVVGGKISLKGLYDKIGITSEVISLGQNSGVLSSLNPFNETERAAMKRMFDGFYKIFTEKAAEGRDIPIEKLQELAQGRIYSGLAAKEVGLVDELGTLEDAISYAKKLAGISEEDTIQKMILPKPTSPFEQLFGPIDSDARTSLMKGVLSDISEKVDPGLLEKMDILTFINILSKESCMAVMPFHLSVK